MRAEGGVWYSNSIVERVQPACHQTASLTLENEESQPSIHSPPTSAAITVLELPELYEVILDYLEAKDVCRTSSTRRKIAAIVKDPPKLQAKLLLKELPEDLARFSKTSYYVHVVNLTPLQEEFTHYSSERIAAIEKTSPGISRRLHQIRPVIFNDLILQPRHMLRTNMSNVASRALHSLMEFRVEDRRFSDAFEPKLFQDKMIASASCRAMFLSQPPVNRVLIGVNWSHWEVSNPVGVRFGHILSAAASIAGPLSYLYVPGGFVISQELADTIQQQLNHAFTPNMLR